jgi:hypothetical protein
MSPVQFKLEQSPVLAPVVILNRTYCAQFDGKRTRLRNAPTPALLAPV